MDKELRESRLLASSSHGRVFTQFLTHKFTHLSTRLCQILELPRSKFGGEGSKKLWAMICYSGIVHAALNKEDFLKLENSFFDSTASMLLYNYEQCVLVHLKHSILPLL